MSLQAKKRQSLKMESRSNHLAFAYQTKLPGTTSAAHTNLQATQLEQYDATDV